MGGGKGSPPLEFHRVVEGGQNQALFAEGRQAGVPVVQYRVDDGSGQGVAFALVLAEGQNGLAKGTNMGQAVAGGGYGDFAVLQLGNAGPTEIVVLVAGVGHDDFHRTNGMDSHGDVLLFRGFP